MLTLTFFVNLTHDRIRPRLWSLARSSLVKTTGFWLSVPACGRLAARERNGQGTQVMETASENVR